MLDHFVAAQEGWTLLDREFADQFPVGVLLDDLHGLDEVAVVKVLGACCEIEIADLQLGQVCIARLLAALAQEDGDVVAEHGEVEDVVRPTEPSIRRPHGVDAVQLAIADQPLHRRRARHVFGTGRVFPPDVDHRLAAVMVVRQ